MYRVLLKSMNMVCSGWPRDWDPRRSCREGQREETEREPARIQPILSGYPAQSTSPSFTVRLRLRDCCF